METAEVLGLIHAHKYDGGGIQRYSPGVADIDEEEAGGQNDIEPGDTMCPCGREYHRVTDWVECGKCHRWCHLQCTGFESLEMAQEKSYTCLVCKSLQYFRRPPACGTTLIVCPYVILSQWDNEIERHSQPGSLRVIVYPGVKEATRRHDMDLLDPDHLASYDIVLTTFDVLNADLAHTDNAFVTTDGEKPLKLRRTKRYRVVPSPLACLEWWRVVLDEAQMVESSTTAAAKMALRLKTVHRWCVSGTPIWKGQVSFASVYVDTGSGAKEIFEGLMTQIPLIMNSAAARSLWFATLFESQPI